MVAIISLFAFNNTFCIGDYTKSNPKPNYCKFTYITKRLSAYTSSDSDTNTKDTDWQNKQAVIAIGGGGRF